MGPWPYFWVFSAANAFLAYGATRSWMDLVVGILLLLLPCLFLIRSRTESPDPGEAPLWEDRTPFPGLWMIFLILALGLAIRSYGLTSLSVWPLWDDAANSYISIEQFEHWRWKLWFHWEKLPFLHFWPQALFFHWFPPSLFSMWLLPALFSIASLPLGYWACRQFFHRNFSIFFLAVLSLNFWAPYVGRFCIPGSFCLCWQFLTLGLLGSFSRSLGKPQAVIHAVRLSLCSVTGLYIWSLTLPTVLFAGTGALWICRKDPVRRERLFLALSIPFLLLGWPALQGILDSVLKGHIHEHLLQAASTQEAVGKWMNGLSYGTALLWGPLSEGFCFGPIWGGFLNPFLGSAFLLGLVELFRFGKTPVLWILAYGLGLQFFPAVISSDLEMFRITLAIPSVLWIVALGAQKLFLALPPLGPIRKISWVLLALSLMLDFYHLSGPYHQWATPGIHSSFLKSSERYRAFPILQRKTAQEGPGIILTEFVPNVFDQSLLIASYPINAARNPALFPHRARWAALLATEPQRSYLMRRFPSARQYPLSLDLQKYDEALFLVVVPIGANGAEAFDPWIRLNNQLQSFYTLIPYDTDRPNYGPILTALLEIYGSSKQDPFLEACLRDKIGQYEYSGGDLDHYLKTIQPILLSPLASSLDFRRAGTAYLKLGYPRQATECFKRAEKLNPLNRPPAEIWDLLDRLNRAGPAHKKKTSQGE